MKRVRWILLAVVVAACSNPRAWYRVDDYPGFTGRPLLDFEEQTEVPPPEVENPQVGWPARMMKFCQQLQVNCAYCHVDAEVVAMDLTTPGTTSRLMMDLADRFKVECNYCHDGSPTRYTRAGRFALRDIRTPERRWACASCHDAGFKVTRRG